MLSVIIGLVIFLLSLWGIARNYQDVVMVLRGLLPLLFLVGGLIVIFAGITAIRDNIIESKKNKESGNKV